MRLYFKYLFFIAIVFTSCKTKKNMIDANAKAKNISAKKVAKKHIAVDFQKSTIDAKLKVNFNNGKTNQSLTVNMKIKKDEVIWLKGSKFITVFKAKITPTSVSYYSPFAKNYFTGDFSMIKELLGVEINFKQLQNLFLGQSLKDLKDGKQDVEIVNNTYVLKPEEQDLMYDIFYAISPSHFKVDNQYIVNTEKQLRLDIKYPSYDLLNDEVFPSQINIKAKNSKSTTLIDLIYKSVVFDTEVGMNFKIPSGYKLLSF
jgi:hypothetical protein